MSDSAQAGRCAADDGGVVTVQCRGITAKRSRCSRNALGTDYGGVTPSGRTRCWHHLPRAERDALNAAREAAEAAAWQEAIAIEPACWSWPVTDEIRDRLARSRDQTLSRVERAFAFIDALRIFDQGRCAVCGAPGNEVEDHCHWTGRVRGWLCRSCNTREGMDRHPDTVFGTYRRRHPYMILGIDEPYTGYGWENGAPVGGWWPGWGEPPDDPWSNNVLTGIGL
jgi:hypothetical protein